MVGEGLLELHEAARVLGLEGLAHRSTGVRGRGSLHGLFPEHARDVRAHGRALVPLVRIGTPTAADGGHRQTTPGMVDGHVQRRVGAHGMTHDVGPLQPETVEHRHHVVARDVLAVGFGLVGDVGRQVAAGVEGDAAVGAREVPHLRLEAPVVPGELVHEHEGDAPSRFLIVQTGAVGRGDGRQGRPQQNPARLGRELRGTGH